MAELIVEPDARGVIIDLLNEEFTARRMRARAAGRRVGGRCVKVTQSGGGELLSMVLVTPWITLEAFDDTESGADELLRMSSALIYLNANTVRPGGTQIYDVDSLGLGSSSFDPDDDQPKSTRVLTVGMRATAL